MPFADNQQQSAEQAVKTAPILILAMLMGLVSFAGFGVFRAVQGPPSPGFGAPGPPPGTAISGIDDQYLLVAMGVMTVFAGFAQVLFAKIAVGRARAAAAKLQAEQDKRDAIAPAFMIFTIMRAAIAEGGGLLGAMIVFTSGNMLGMVGVAFAVLFLVLLLPARSRFESLYRNATETRFGM